MHESVLPRNGRTLTTLIKTDGSWLADTIWFKQREISKVQNMSDGKTALGLDNNLGALLCYLNICFPFGLIYSIIVLVTDKTNKLPRFHAVQSILLSLVGIPLAILYLLGTVIGAAIAYAIYAVVDIPIPVIPLIWLLITLFAVVIFIGGIIAAIRAFQGHICKLPLIGRLADRFSNTTPAGSIT